MQDDNIMDPRSRWKITEGLIKDINMKQASGKNQIILGIDANEVLADDGQPASKYSISYIKRQCSLVHIFEYQHTQTGDNSINKNNKIDHLLVSQDIFHVVLRSGFLPWGAAMGSDHRT